MAKQVIQLGTSANDGTGDPLRTAFTKVNANFTELYTSIETIPTDISQLTDHTNLLGGGAVNLGNFKIDGSTLATVAEGNPSGWGGYSISIDPGGESNGGIYIPGINGQQTGGTLQIFNTDSSGGKVNINTYGGLTIGSARGTLGLGLDLEAPGSPSHFHLAFETSNTYIPTADLFFGDDYNYLQLVNSAQGVFIGTNNRDGGDQNVWRFTTSGNFTAPGRVIIGGNGSGLESHLEIDASNYWSSIQWTNLTSLQDPNAGPFECQAQLLRVFSGSGEIEGHEELVAVSAVKPTGTTYNGLMFTTSDGKIPDAPYNDGVGTMYSWVLGGDGTISFPTLNGNARTGFGNNLQFQKSNYEKIISTQNGTSDNQTVERLVISGGDSYYDGSAYHGEGGDLYLWAGRGENGGDIKVDAGNSLSAQEGGNIKIRGGTSSNGTGGFVEIRGGYGDTSSGEVRLYSGNTQWTYDANGTLTLPNTAYIDSGIPTLKTTQDFSIGVGYPQKVWNFDQLGKITLPVDGDIVNSDGYSVIKSLPQNQQSDSADYTLQLSDAGKHVLKDEGDGYSVVVPTNSSVAFPIGTVVTIVSGNSWTYIYPADGNTTEVWGAGYNQTSTAWYIPNNSMATLLKIGTDKWMLSGAGLAID